MIRRALIATVAVALLLSPIAPASVAAAPDPVACTGYPEAREMREAQAWWGEGGLSIPDQVGTHIHLSTCWPKNNVVVSGTLHVDVHIRVYAGDESLHHFLERMRINWRPYSSESGGGLLLDSRGDWDIPLDENGDGVRTFGINLNLSGLGSATRRIRFNAMAGQEPDLFFVGTDWALHVRKKTVGNPRILGKGWYSDHGYQNPVLSFQIPSGPVPEIWCVPWSANPGGGGRPTVQHADLVDPDMHHGMTGLIVRMGSGRFSGKTCLDTKLLENGPHKRVFISRDTKLAGVIVVPFVVDN